jgi:hypothetical protein
MALCAGVSKSSNWPACADMAKATKKPPATTSPRKIKINITLMAHFFLFTKVMGAGCNTYEVHQVKT